MKFIKSNYKLIFKTFFFQIVISLLGMMLGTATGSYNALRLLGAVCAVIVYLYIIGLHFWKKGAEDAVKGPEIKLPLSGLVSALVAFLPSIVCVLICYFLPMQNAAGEANGVFALFAVTKLIFMGVYFGFAAVMFPTGGLENASEIIAASKSQSGIFVIALIPALVVCAVTYAMGYKNKDPLNLFRNESRIMK